MLLPLLLLELIVILGIGYFIVKRLTSKPTEVHHHNHMEEDPTLDKYAVERAVRDGVISAIKQLDVEKEQDRYISESSRRERASGGVYMIGDRSDEPAKKAGGNLVPFNLNEQEKEILNMFYNED
jgi:hypothetical protein